MRGRPILLALLCATACAGCGGEPPKPVDRFQVKQAKHGQGYDLSVAVDLPPLDEDRLELSVPEGWKAMSRSSQYVIRFDRGGSLGLPRIEVEAEDSPYEFDTLTAENVEDFARVLDKAVAGPAIIEPPKPMIIGGTPCARYVIGVRLQTRTGGVLDAERQVIETIYKNRLYRVTLLILEGDILKYRDAAYAVVASIKFQEGEDFGGSVFGDMPTLDDVKPDDAKSDDAKPDDKKPDGGEKRESAKGETSSPTK
ncbi:MAG: hypothetical protein RIC55_04655 [Pirellulaceae bacterium]